MRQDIPQWAKDFAPKGSHLRCASANTFSVVEATSKYVKGSKPKSVQTYLGTIDKNGFHPKEENSKQLEWGLSSFIYNRYKREIMRRTYGYTKDVFDTLFRLAIILFVHGFIDDDSIVLSFIGYEKHESLTEALPSINMKRLEKCRDCIADEFKKDFKDLSNKAKGTLAFEHIVGVNSKMEYSKQSKTLLKEIGYEQENR